jgi:hypothetical protein
MGYYFVSTGKFVGIRSKKGYSIIRPESWRKFLESDDVEAELDYSGVDEIAIKNKLKMPLSLKRMMAKDLSRHPNDYISMAVAKIQHPGMLRYEKSKYEAYIRRIAARDLEFHLSRADLEETHQDEGNQTSNNINYAVDCLLHIFLADSQEITHEIGTSAIRIARKRPTLFRLFSNKNSGETICMFSVADIQGVEVSTEHLLFLLKGGMRCSVASWGEGARIYKQG